MAAKELYNKVINSNSTKEILSLYSQEIQDSAKLICAENPKTKIIEAETEDILDGWLLQTVKVQMEYGKYYNIGILTNKVLSEDVVLTDERIAEISDVSRFKLHSILFINGTDFQFISLCNCDKRTKGNLKKRVPSLYKLLNDDVLLNMDNLIEEKREPRKFKRITDVSGLGYPINTIVKGNCVEKMKKMADNCVDFVLTDIPYDEVSDNDIDRSDGNTKGIRVLNKGVADEITFDLPEFLEEVHRVCTNSFVIFCGFAQLSDIVKFFRDKGDSVRVIVWHKPSFSPINCDLMYGSNVELGVWARKHNNGVFNAFYKGTVFTYNPCKSDYHTTPKNVELFKELILDNTNPDYLVFDPCIGSGTTAKACMELDRNFLGMELDDKIYERTVKDIEAIRNPGMY